MRYLALPLVAALLLAGCNTTSKHPAQAVRDTHPCSQSNYYMQCAGRPGLKGALPPKGLSAVAYGVDFGWSCPLPSGASFGASYLSFDRSKNWTPGCVSAYHRSGRSTVAVWETGAARATAGYGAGQADARAARGQAAALGEPSSRPIYFAVDFDSTGRTGQILGYFQGVDSVLGRSRTGGYGGLATIRALFGSKLIRYGWQTAAWSGGVWDARAQLEQYGFGATLDWNRATSRDYGQWPYAKPKPPPAPVSGHANALCREYAHYKREKRAGHFPPKNHARARAVRNALAHHHYGCHIGTGKAYRR